MFAEERHGRGPLHFSTTINGLVLELYPTSSGTSASGPQRIGIIIEGIPAMVRKLRSVQIDLHSNRTDQNGFVHPCFLDPDGRIVELSEPFMT